MRFPFKQIEDILAEVNNKYIRINWGGCGVMAGILAQHLTPIVHDIKIVSYGPWSRNSNIDDARPKVCNNSMADWEVEGIGFGHVWVEFKWNGSWYAVDCEGIRTRAQMYDKWGSPCGGSWTVKEIKAISNNRQGWNSSFRRDQVPSMRNHIGRQFNNLFYY